MINFFAMAYSAGNQRHSFLWPFLISLTAHLLLFGFIIYRSTVSSSDESFFLPSVIEVKMVEMPAGGSAPKKVADQSSEKAPVADKPTKPATEPAASVQEADVSIAPPKPKAKVPLKYKTFKTKKVLKNALKRLERKVEGTTPKPLEDTIKRLREKVEKEGRPETQDSDMPEGKPQGKEKGYAVGSKEEGEAIDIYQLEVAYAIKKQWAFSQQMAGSGGKLVASITFKVMPDGHIVDIYFDDRSGNNYLNESAYKAIVKASPVKPHPPGLNRPYVAMGLRFTPEGVQ